MTKLMRPSALASLLGTGLFLLNTATYAVPAPVVIQAYGQHIGNNIIYTHQVTNNTSRNIAGFSIGKYSDRVGLGFEDYTNRGELRPSSLPIGSTEDEPIGPVLPGSVSGLTGWSAEIILIEESGLYLGWNCYESPAAPRIQPGQTARFSVKVPQMDSAYVSGHFVAPIAGGHYNGAIEKLDIIPPTLTVTLAPNWVIATNQLYPITATIAVTDNYDPQPEVKLESITVSEVSGAGDVVGAAIGTDDRQFQLRGSLAGSPSGFVGGNNLKIPRSAANRVYTVTYSAMDGSGNKTLTSEMVTVQPNYSHAVAPAPAPAVPMPPPPRPPWWRWW
jgi:hypothetical protein